MISFSKYRMTKELRSIGYATVYSDSKAEGFWKYGTTCWRSGVGFLHRAPFALSGVTSSHGPADYRERLGATPRRGTMKTEPTNEQGNPLGFCNACFRVRWLGVVEARDAHGTPQGTCTQCVRENRPALDTSVKQ